MQWMRDRGFLALLIANFLGVIGLVSGLVTIFTGLGIIAGISSIALVLVIALLTLLTFRPLIVPNWHGVNLRTAILQTNLTDIEDRNPHSRHLAPIEFHEQAQQEIAITGITLATTFQLYADDLLKALRDKHIHVYVLLLDPHCDDVQVINHNEGRTDIGQEIRQTLIKMQSHGFLNYSNFEVRFLQQRPPFTSVMIDGNITQVSHWRDGAQIRVQPSGMYITGQNGIIFQFRFKGERKKGTGNTRRQLRGGFDFFAEDVRRQWAHGQARPDYLQHPEQLP